MLLDIQMASIKLTVGVFKAESMGESKEVNYLER
jgi:hypothetical protein